MNAKCLSLILGFLTVLAACGKPQSSSDQMTQHSAPTATPAALATTAAQAAHEAQEKAASASVVASKITRTNEDGSETVEDTTGDSGTHNPLLAAVASAAAATTSTATPWIEGTNYTRLVPAQPTAAPAGQVEVLEFFWYACPHCYAIDPLVDSWLKTKPSYVNFSRVPVMWNEGHRSQARLYYTLESMGKLKELHSEIFKAIHVGGNPLMAKDPNDAAESEKLQSQFVRKFGISEDDFKKAYHSFSVENSLQRADQLVQRYRVAGVPSFVVNGKFIADVGTAQGPERLLSLVNDLALAEHKH